MKKEPIDFQEFDVSVEDGVEAGVKRVHGRSILNKTKPNAVVYFDTVEDFDKAPDEPSVFDTIIDRLYSLKGEELRIVINGAVCSLLNAIDCLGRDAMEIFAKAITGGGQKDFRGSANWRMPITTLSRFFEKRWR